jgi:GNAT superfamily N-acetyltransferase
VLLSGLGRSQPGSRVCGNRPACGPFLAATRDAALPAAHGTRNARRDRGLPLRRRTRRGVGRALLAAAEDRAGRLGLGRVSLETEVDNDPARSLYESCGFTPGEVGRPLRGLPRYVAYVKLLAD